MPPGAGHGGGTGVRHATAPSSEKCWERHRPCNTHTHTHTHTPRRRTGVPKALSPLHARRWTQDDTAEFICVEGRTPLRSAQSPILKGQVVLARARPLVRSRNSLNHPALENASCYLSWSTFLVSKCSSCRHRGNKTTRRLSSTSPHAVLQPRPLSLGPGHSSG